MIIKVKGHQYRRLAGGFGLEIGQFLDMASTVVTWWIEAFCAVCNNLNFQGIRINNKYESNLLPFTPLYDHTYDVHTCGSTWPSGNQFPTYH